MRLEAAKQVRKNSSARLHDVYMRHGDVLYIALEPFGTVLLSHVIRIVIVLLMFIYYKVFYERRYVYTTCTWKCVLVQ